MVLLFILFGVSSYNRNKKIIITIKKKKKKEKETIENKGKEIEKMKNQII